MQILSTLSQVNIIISKAYPIICFNKYVPYLKKLQITIDAEQLLCAAEYP